MMIKANWFSIFGLLAAGALPLSVEAADKIVVCVQNTTGLSASDLHVTFTGTGGNLYVDPFSVVALFCPTPAVPSNGSVGNTAVIDWGTNCVGPGGLTRTIHSLPRFQAS